MAHIKYFLLLIGLSVSMTTQALWVPIGTGSNLFFIEIAPSVAGGDVEEDQPGEGNYSQLNISWNTSVDAAYYEVWERHESCYTTSPSPLGNNTGVPSGFTDCNFNTSLVYRGNRTNINHYQSEDGRTYSVYACDIDNECTLINNHNNLNINVVQTDVTSVPQRDYHYEIRYGDINDDDQVDFYIRRLNGDYNNGIIQEALLQQNDNWKFISIDAYQYQLETARSWQPLNPNLVGMNDYNADGNIDLAILNIDEVIATFVLADRLHQSVDVGVSNNEIVQIIAQMNHRREMAPKGLLLYSSGEPGSGFVSKSPQVITAIDDDFIKFFRDINQWFHNSNYFTDNAFGVEEVEVTKVVGVEDNFRLTPVGECVQFGCTFTPISSPTSNIFSPVVMGYWQYTYGNFTQSVVQCSLPLGTRFSELEVYGCYLVSDTFCPLINISASGLNEFFGEVMRLNPFGIYQNYQNNCYERGVLHLLHRRLITETRIEERQGAFDAVNFSMEAKELSNILSIGMRDGVISDTSDNQIREIISNQMDIPIDVTIDDNIPTSLENAYRFLKTFSILAGYTLASCQSKPDDYFDDPSAGSKGDLGLLCWQQILTNRISISSCSAPNYAITQNQQNLFNTSARKAFWESRLNDSCDPVAPIAIAVINDVGLGAATNRWLENVAESEGIAFNATLENKIGLELIEGHIEETRVDVENEEGTSGLLSAHQVADYHHVVFDNNRLPPHAFGGTPFSDELFLDSIWCIGCDPVFE